MDTMLVVGALFAVAALFALVIANRRQRHGRGDSDGGGAVADGSGGSNCDSGSDGGGCDGGGGGD